MKPSTPPVSNLDPDVSGVHAGEHGTLFTGGAYRANLYVYDVGGRRLQWFVIRAESVSQGRYFTLGRSQDCNIALDDGASSTRHAYIAGYGSELLLRDLESTNGTEVNGEPVEEVVLCHGDIIRIGTTDIRFLYSYKEPPVRLLLDFEKGPNAGKCVTNYTASATMGRSGCSVNLPGTGVAPQHVRVDAFGKQLCYVINLRAENYTWLNDRPVVGIAEAREGDVLRLGDHEIRLRIEDDPNSAEAPEGDGTLQMIDVSTNLESRDSQQQVALRASAVQRKLDEALISGHQSPSDPTSSDPVSVQSLEEAIEQAKALSRSGSAPDLDETPVSDHSMSASGVRKRVLAKSATGPTSWGEHPPVPIPVEHGKPALRRHIVHANPRRHQRRRKKRGGGLLKGLVVLLVGVGLTIGAAALVPMQRSISLGGEMAPGDAVPLVARTRGRIEQVRFRLGDAVVAGDLVVNLLDLDVQDQVDDLQAQIDTLEKLAASRQTGRTGRAAAAIKQELSTAEARLAKAERLARDRLEAFNRREVGYAELDQARNDEDAARKTVSRLRLELEGARRSATRNRKVGDVLSEISALIAEKERLEVTSDQALKSPRSGLLLRAEARPVPHEGQRVSKGEVLFQVADVERLKVKLRVPDQYLGAVEAAGQGVLTPEGQPDLQLSLRLGRPGDVKVRGMFPLDIEVPNPDRRLRPGQRVTVEVQLPEISALEWMIERISGKE
ncbi:MAG: FHA domain-containing protein [Bradymonadia bacterium]